MKAMSDNLIHFLGREFRNSPGKQFEIFKLIVKDGLRCGRTPIKFGESGVIYSKTVCFTDLPLSYCDEHTATYGKFGIGFKKAFIKKNGGNPVRYFVDSYPMETKDTSVVENRGMLYADLCNHLKIVKGLHDELIANDKLSIHDEKGNLLLNHSDLINWVNQQIAVFSFEKGMGDLGPARDETKEIDLYYKEREWRLVPFLANLISGSVQYGNEGLMFYKFEREDVNMVVVPNEEMRKIVLDYFEGLISSPNTSAREHAFGENPPPIISYDDLLKW
jgi:hypothetical protein